MVTGADLDKNEEEWPEKLKIKNIEVEEIIEETYNKLTIFDYFANWQRLIIFKQLQNTIAYVSRRMRKDKPKSLCITAEEKQQATKVIFKWVQQENFKQKQTHLEKLNSINDAEGL